jgi:hypothetical protein
MSRQAARERVVSRLGASCLVAALLVAASSGWGSAPWWAAAALAVAVTVTEVAVVHLQFGRQQWTFSLTEAALAVALVVSTGAWTVVGVGVGVAVAQRLRRQPALKQQFTLAQFSVAVALAQAASAGIDGQVLRAGAGLAVFWAVKYLVVAVAASLRSGRRLTTLLLASAPLSAVHAAASSSVGLLAAFLASEAPLGLLAFVVPLVLLWSAHEAQTRRAAEAHLYAELARGQERATGRSHEASATVVVSTAARVLGRADVELVLQALEGPISYVGDAAGGAQRRPLRPGALNPAWAMRALADSGISTGVDDGRPWLTAVIGPADAPLAVLRARRGDGAAAFARHDVRLVEVLAGEAATWLAGLLPPPRGRSAVAEQAARALGDVGAATAPALTVLRDSADRLARLAESPDGVEHIVEELHHVEQAVASLLGAVALAAEPDLLHLPEPHERPETEQESDWTTTGVLR